LWHRLLALCCSGVALLSTESCLQTPATTSGDSPELEDGGVKKRRRSKKKKDPNEPRKPKSAYLFFCAEFRANLDPPVSFKETTALVCSSLQPCRFAVMQHTCQTAVAMEPCLLSKACYPQVLCEQICDPQGCACDNALTRSCGCNICR